MPLTMKDVPKLLARGNVLLARKVEQDVTERIETFKERCKQAHAELVRDYKLPTTPKK